MLYNQRLENERTRIKNKYEEMNFGEEVEYEDYKSEIRNDNLRETNRRIEENNFQENYRIEKDKEKEMVKKKYDDKTKEMMIDIKNKAELNLKEYNYKNEEILNNIENSHELDLKKIKNNLEENLEKLRTEKKTDEMLKELSMKQNEAKHESNINKITLNKEKIINEHKINLLTKELEHKNEIKNMEIENKKKMLEYEGEVLGGCGYYPTEGLPMGYAELVKFYFSPKLRGKGMGKKLMLQVIEAAKTAGYSNLYIESFTEFSHAVSMYEKLGFNHIPNRLGNSGHTATTIYMLKNLSSTH